ncbi:MAG: hypothetical protein JWO97_1916 [Acidobacteria bacterium]|nr:hypothetical protein [Acidobacteriota bacterium]
MKRSLLRFVLFAAILILMFAAVPAFADEPAGCQTCRAVVMEEEATLECGSPDPDEWGYDSCSTGVRQGAHGEIHWCRVGGSMCYYFEVNG